MTLQTRHLLLALFLVSVIGLPAGAQVPVHNPVVEAETDLVRCGAGLDALPGADKCEVWAVRHTGSAYSYPMSIAVSPTDGTVFAMGVTQGEIEFVDDMTTAGETTAHDPETGEVLWTAATRGDWGLAVLHDMAVAPDGSKVFVAGFTQLAVDNADFLVQALDAATGALVWEARYDGPARYLDSADALTVSGSRVIVTGQTHMGSGAINAATLAFDADTGEQLWESRFNGAGIESRPVAITTSPDGSLALITGKRETGPGISDSYIVAYDVSTGEEAWKTVFNGPKPGWHSPTDLVASEDAVFLAATIHDTATDTREYSAAAFDLDTGQKLWSSMHVIGQGGWSAPSSIGVTPDGARVFVTGVGDSGEANAAGRDYMTVAYDASTGSELWSDRFDGAAGGRDQASSLVVSPDGGSVIVTGRSDTGPSEIAPSGPASDYATIAYDTATGNRQWMARYNATPSQIDIAYDLALSPSGDAVYVTGSGLGPPRGPNAGEVQFQTVAYDLEP
jgi:outer membrane protein assembly factor BamB